MSNLFGELKRRNVFRVAIAYAAVAWLIIQVADIALENFGAPGWVMKTLIFVLAIGFPVAVLFAWAYEMTPEGIRREKDVDRSQSITHKTGQKLNRMIIGVLVVVIGLLLVDKFLLQSTAPESVATDRSVAVLPFVAMSRGPDDEYFADGLTEEILNSLTRIPELLVTARTSAFHFKGQDLPIPEVAAKLGVGHVVEGSVRRDGDRLRVTAQLIRASDGFHLWSKNYDRETTDTLSVQTDIAEAISSALGVVLDDTQRERMHEAGIRNPDAFIALQKGYEAFEAAHGSTELLSRLATANTWLEKALELEPGIADAYAAHADYYAHFLMVSLDTAGSDISDEQREDAYQHLVADLDNAIRTAADESRRITNSLDLAIVTGNWRGLPGLVSQLADASGCSGVAWADVVSAPYGYADDYARYAERMVSCDPLSFHGWRGLVMAQVYQGDTDGAIRTALRALDTTPHIRIRQELNMAYLAAGRFDDAEQRIRRDIRGEYSVLIMQLALALARGDDDTGDALLERLEQFERLPGNDTIVNAARAGRRAAANELAATIDGFRFGHLRLMLVAGICKCGAPWDIEVTPNFAELLQDANLPWPPASPVAWPLKDW